MTDLRIEFILGMDDIGKDNIKDVDITMLDYDYVGTCDDVATLKEILRVLVSGKEGRFPQLEEVVVDRVLALIPDKERKTILSMSSKISSVEIETHKASLSKWVEEFANCQNFVARTDSNANSSDSTSTDKGEEDIFSRDNLDKQIQQHDDRYPPVRGKKISTVPPSSLKAPDMKATDIKKTGNDGGNGINNNKDGTSVTKRISKESLSNRDYFRAWDKFDFDEAERKVVNEEEVEVEVENMNKKCDVHPRAPKTEEKWKTGLQKQTSRTTQELNDLRQKMKYCKLSNAEQKFIVSREKDKGNEYFRNKEYEEAYICYSKSLALDDQNAILYANRAMVCIRLSKLCQAVSDCTQALLIDPNYTKALARRGMVHHKCGRFKDAKEDFTACVNKEPHNKEYCMLLKRSTEKVLEMDGDKKHEKSKKKIIIVQDDDSDSDSSDEELIEEIYTPGALCSK
jgi:tetratricopeptide (TPR) repeat protein